jgi:hypothetical protein
VSVIAFRTVIFVTPTTYRSSRLHLSLATLSALTTLGRGRSAISGNAFGTHLSALGLQHTGRHDASERNGLSEGLGASHGRRLSLLEVFIRDDSDDQEDGENVGKTSQESASESHDGWIWREEIKVSIKRL